MSSQTQTKGAVMANAKSKWPVKLPVHGDGGVNSVAISKDGKTVVGCTYFYNKGAASVTKQVGVYVFDEKGNQKFKDEFSATAPPGPGHGKRGVKTGVHFVALSRDGAWAASSGFIGTSSPTPANPGFINAYDVASGTVFPLLNTSEQAGMVAISKDGTYLAAAADKLYLFKRSGSGATATWSAPQSIGFSDILRSVAISNDGKWIVAGISGGQVALVQNNGGTLGASTVYDMPVKSFPDRFWALGVAVSGKGNAFAIAGENATLYFFDIPGNWPGTLSEAWSETLPGTASCRSVALADDGSRVVAVASDGGVGMPAGNGLLFVFDKSHVAGSALWSPPANTMHGPNCVSMDKAGDYVAAADGTPKTGGSGNFYLFDAAAGTAGWSPATNKMNYPIQIAADGAFAVGGCDDGHVYYFTVP